MPELEGTEKVFPASAGVILRQLGVAEMGRGFPRIRGGDPKFEKHETLQWLFSPHPRG